MPWYEQVDPDTFFPRCYRLSHDEEKLAFIGELFLRISAGDNIKSGRYVHLVVSVLVSAFTEQPFDIRT